MSDSNIGGETSILEERRKKLDELRAENKAYINDFHKSDDATDIHEKYGHLSRAELEKEKIKGLVLAGRIVLKRVMGETQVLLLSGMARVIFKFTLVKIILMRVCM